MKYGLTVLLTLFLLVDTLKMWGYLEESGVYVEASIFSIPNIPEEKITDIKIILPEEDVLQELEYIKIEEPPEPSIIPVDYNNKKLLEFSELDRYRERIEIDAKSESTKDYIKRFLPTALVEQSKYGIPASLKLAQGLLESNVGKSLLARKANNHFGIKGIKGYNLHDDDPNDKFVIFKSAWHSWRGHSLVLRKETGRYLPLFAEEFNSNYFEKYRNLKGCYNCKVARRVKDHKFDEKLKLLKENWHIPYKRFAYGLDICGYATDNNYANKLITLIEENNLTTFDVVKVNL